MKGERLKVKGINRRFIAGLIAILMAVLPACKRTTPTPRQTYPATYTTAYEQIFGHCYDSLPDLAVVGLDLYSEGVELDADSVIRGTGYNLYFSDIFVPDSLLKEGEYKSLPVNPSSVQPFTFISGKDFEGMLYGMYILTIEEDKVTKIQVLDSGSFVYRDKSLQFTLYYTNSEGNPTTYTCSYSGALIPWLKR